MSRKKMPGYRAERVRLADEIIAEVVFPKQQTGKVAIVCSGAPTYSPKAPLLRFLASWGYVAFALRYRGTWESGGFFLSQSPATDIRDCIDVLVRHQRVETLSVLGNTSHTISVKRIHLFGVSFGGPAVLLNSNAPKVEKVIAVSPVLDWSVAGEDEPFDAYVRNMTEAFPGGYRVKHSSDWNRLINTDFYSPVAHVKEIKGAKVFILHAGDDRVVPPEPVGPFADSIGADYYLKPKGGHPLRFTQKFLWKKIEAFLRKK